MRQKEYIASLLEKFLEGQSTEAEEQTLSEYFDRADDVPAECCRSGAVRQRLR